MSILVHKKPYPIGFRLVSPHVAFKRIPELNEPRNKGYEGKWVLFETDQLLPPSTSFSLKVGPEVRTQPIPSIRKV